MGATVRQIASRLDDRAERIAEVLDTLRSRGDVLQMGRGLFVLRAFERLAEREDFVDPAAFVERFGEAGERHLSGSVPRTRSRFRSNETLPVHRWWPYVQGYSAEFVAGVLTAADLPADATVLDPFAGSGTTLVEARRAGARAVGTELLAQRGARGPGEDALRARLGNPQPAAGRVLDGPRGRRCPGSSPFLRETPRHFAPRGARRPHPSSRCPPSGGRPAADALRLAFGRILIPVEPAPPVPLPRLREAVERPRGPGVRAVPAARSTEMSEDLRLSNRARSGGPPAEVRSARCPHVGAARSLRSPRRDESALCERDGLRDELQARPRVARICGLLRGAGAPPATRTSPATTFPGTQTPRTARTRTSRTRGSPNPEARSGRTSPGRERTARRHARIVHRYFLDLRPRAARRLSCSRPGGRFVLVVGDSLLAGRLRPGGPLLARIGAARGFRSGRSRSRGTRRSGQRRSFELRESIVTLERPRAAR